MNRKTEAKCDGQTLTVGFHGANPPLIWRFDLERNHSFTLSLNGEEGDWELGVTGPRGDFFPVVHFIAREDAEEAFAKVEKLLAHRRAGWPSVARALIALVGLIIVIFVGVSIFGLSMSQHRTASLSTPLAPNTASQTIPDGVPLSADDVLKPPAQ